MLKKVFSHTAIYGLAPHISKIASIFVLPIITKDLTETDYGIAGTLTAYTGTISVLSTLGLRMILVNSFYKSPSQYKWAWRQIYGFLSLWAIPFAVLLSFLLYFVIPYEAKHNALIIISLNVLPIVAFGNTATLGATYYQVKKKPLQIGIRTALISILAVILNLVTISYLKLGYMGWFWTTFVTGIISNISYWIPINLKLGFTPIFNFKWRTIKAYLKTSLPTIPHYYSGYLLNSSDRMVMDWHKVSTGDIGKYNIAYTIGGLIEKVAVASGLAIGPLMNEAYKQGNDIKARNLVFILQLSLWILTFTISLWMKEIFYALIKNDVLNKMYPLAIIIAMSYNYRPMYYGANHKIFYAERTNQLWKVTTVAGIANLLLNLLLIPFFGYQIAAVTTFVSLLYMGYAGFFMSTFKEINHVSFYPLFWLLGTVSLTMAAYFMVEFEIIYKLIISLTFLILGVTTIYKFNIEYFGKRKSNRVHIKT